MKKRTKLTFAGIVTIGAAMILSGCTASFCSTVDKAHIMYALDYGVSDYYSADEYDVLYQKYNQATPDEKAKMVLPEKVWDDNDQIYYLTVVPTSTSSAIGKTNKDAASKHIKTPTSTYFEVVDRLVLEQAIKKSRNQDDLDNFSTVSYQEALDALDTYGYLKYSNDNSKEYLWTNWDELYKQVSELADKKKGIVIDDLPTNDWVKLYKDNMKAFTKSYRSCIAITEDDYGYYGYANGLHYRDADKVSVKLEAKDWKYAWKTGPMEGLLVFPIGWLTESFVLGFKSAGVAGGIAQLLAILAITFIVRSLMLLVTFKQTTNNAKMQALQPEITRIQNKYPNANNNTYEKQQMAAEMNKLYKKHKINPLSSLLVMIVQFPVFICVWNALQGSASLSSDSFLNLRLSDSINNVLFNPANWATGGAVTALILFLLMAGAQVVSMLLPQWIQKAKRKQIASLGKNPAQNDQQSKMKMFTYIMMAMIIFMGFTLPSAMGVYWFVGALFSIGQTLIIEKINNSKSKKKGK